VARRWGGAEASTTQPRPWPLSRVASTCQLCLSPRTGPCDQGAENRELRDEPMRYSRIPPLFSMSRVCRPRGWPTAEAAGERQPVKRSAAWGICPNNCFQPPDHRPEREATAPQLAQAAGWRRPAAAPAGAVRAADPAAASPLSLQHHTPLRSGGDLDRTAAVDALASSPGPLTRRLLVSGDAYRLVGAAAGRCRGCSAALRPSGCFGAPRAGGRGAAACFGSNSRFTLNQGRVRGIVQAGTAVDCGLFAARSR